MDTLIGFAIAAAILLVIGGCCIANDAPGNGLLVIAIGCCLLVILVGAAPIEIPSGLPKRDISVGEHKVGVIYIAGDNVSVGVEFPHKDDNGKIDGDRLYFYQFSRKAFDGVINAKAKKLVVVEAGAFKKLQLQ